MFTMPQLFQEPEAIEDSTAELRLFSPDKHQCKRVETRANYKIKPEPNVGGGKKEKSRRLRTPG
jgi:hypothetical protein